MANLIDRQTYKDMQGITSTTNDFILSTFIDSVSQLVKTYCNNTFVDHFSVANKKIETFSIDYNTHFVQLTESPVNTIIAVKERTTISSAYTDIISTTSKWYLDSSTDSIYRSNGANGYQSFPTGPGAVVIEYTAGYSNVPEDLKLAVIDLVTYYFKDQTKSRQTIAGASLQVNPTSTMRGNIGFPDHIKRVLDLYKNY